MTLWKLNPEAALFDALADAPPLWWSNLLADGQIWADIRKDNRINVYYRCGSIMDLAYARGEFRAKMHFEYVPVRETSTHVEFTFDDAGLDLDRSAVEIPSLDDFSPDVLKRLKKRIGKFNPPGSEKTIQSEFVLANPAFIDTEFAIGAGSGERAARIDLVWLDEASRRIIFVELKTAGDSRLHSDEAGSTGPEGIGAQLQKYHEFLSTHATDLEDYYRRLLQTKKRLGILRGLVLEDFDDFVVEPRPVLVVGDCTQPWIDHNATRINERIEEFALGAFYHGRTTRRFRVPSMSRKNKYVFTTPTVQSRRGEF